MSGHLNLWTVYANPSDYPGKYVARRSEVRGDGPTVTADLIVADTLRAIREELRNRGLLCLARDPDDDPVIVEIWL